MATHSSTLAWRIPWAEWRGRLQSMCSQRVRHDSGFSFKAARDNCVILGTVVKVPQGQEFVCTSGARPKDDQHPRVLVCLWMSALGPVTPTMPTLPPFVLMDLLVHFPTHFYKIRANATKCFDSSH